MRNKNTERIDIILREIEFVERALLGVEKKDFFRSEVLQRALFLSLLSIGECLHHFSQDFRDVHKEINWRKFVSLRNITAQGYWNLDYTLVWDTLVADVPILKAALLQIKGE